MKMPFLGKKSCRNQTTQASNFEHWKQDAAAAGFQQTWVYHRVTSQA